MNRDARFYRALYRIRRFEETILDNFPKGVFFGTTHTCLGQEADAVGVLSNLSEDDIVFSNHRGHGHFLAYGGDPERLFAELMGRRNGVCGGRGGSQHLQWRNFYSNGIQGGIVPVATGMAFAEKLKRSQAVTVAFLGDGTWGEGVIYESFNLAALWQLPILYVVENNHIAQTTPTDLTFANLKPGAFASRFEAFGIQALELTSSDVVEIAETAGSLLDSVRQECQPRALILHTERFGPHSKGDDTRPLDMVNRLRLERDPLRIHAGRLNAEELRFIEAEVNQEIQAAFLRALDDKMPVL
jgi:TPP-dependent pyruvate/acetoin dehydrogenase alpha subunit